MVLSGPTVDAVVRVATMATGASYLRDSASVSAIAKKQVQILAFDASASGVPYTVSLVYGGSVATTYRMSANTELLHRFDEWGPVAGVGNSVDLRVVPDVKTSIYANLYYKIVDYGRSYAQICECRG